MAIALVSLRAIWFKKAHMREQNVALYCEEKHKQAAPPRSGRKQIIPEKSSEEPAVLTALLHLEWLTPLQVFLLPQQDTCPYAYLGKEKKKQPNKKP